MKLAIRERVFTPSKYDKDQKKNLKKSRMLPKRTIKVDNLSETVNETSSRKSDFGPIFSDSNYVYSLSFIVKLHLKRHTVYVTTH